MVDLRNRSYEKELMDQADCSLPQLRRTIEQFDLVNTLFSASLGLFKKHLVPKLLREPDRTWTFLDFGAGGCDIDRRIVRFCRRRGLKVRFLALDLDERIIPWAIELNRGYPEIEVKLGSIFDLDQLGDFDFILSNHTLHHFTYPEIVLTVGLCQKHAREGFLLNDLRRSFWAYVGFTIFSALFVRGGLIYDDGRLSIRRGFTPQELRSEIEKTGTLSNIEVLTAAPARVYLLWDGFTRPAF